MSRGGPRPANAGDTRLYLGKAVEYLAEAEIALEADRRNVAVGNAVHAGILAADAMVAAVLGHVWKGEDHQGAVAHIAGAGDAGSRASRHLQRLLSLKKRAEYDPEPATAQQATAAVQAAQRLVRAAGDAIERAAP